MRAIPQREPLFLGGSIGGVPSFDLNFARLDNPVTKYGFTFTRATAATYVNAAGLIATAASGELRYTYDPVTLSALGVLIEEQRTNLVNRSEALNNVSVWSPVRTTVATSATTGPDGVAGSSCAILETAVTNTFHLDFVFTPAATTTYVCSVFFKGGLGRGYAAMDATGGGGASGSCAVNLTTGAVSAGSGTVQQYPNGWWRVSFAVTSVTTSAITLRLWASNDGTASPSYAGDITKGIYAWGAQIEAGAFLTSYIPSISASATRNADVLSLTGAAGRTNLVTYSQDLDNAAWDGGNFFSYGSGSVANATTAPDGSTTAEFILPQTTAGVVHYVRHTTATVTASTVYCFSVYVKSGGYSKVAIRESVWTGAWAAFDLSGGGSVLASSGLTASIQSVGSGWYRISGYGSSGGGTSHRYIIYVLDDAYTSDAPNTYTFTANGTSGLYIWGAQLETGSTATTYIVTTNGPRTVENVASWFNGDAGTFLIESVVPPINAAYSSALSINSGSNANQIYIYNNPTPRQYFETRSGSVTVASVHNGSTLSVGSSLKFGMAYQVDDVAVYSNGVAGQTDSSAPLPYALRYVDINAGYSLGKWNGTISRIRYYNRRLPNATLQSLTA